MEITLSPAGIAMAVESTLPVPFTDWRRAVDSVQIDVRPDQNGR